jgi:hypothetical protein
LKHGLRAETVDVDRCRAGIGASQLDAQAQPIAVARGRNRQRDRQRIGCPRRAKLALPLEQLRDGRELAEARRNRREDGADLRRSRSVKSTG